MSANVEPNKGTYIVPPVILLATDAADGALTSVSMAKPTSNNS